MNALLFAGVSSAIASALLTAAVLCYARRHGMFDLPNARSSHEIPTPRGGGLAIVAVVTCALAVLAVSGILDVRSSICIGVAGLAVATVGWVDDRRGVSARLRVVVHAIAVVLALAGTSHLAPLEMPLIPRVVILPYVVATFALVWLLNLFNFMDGIDGIAASEALFVAVGIAICVRLGETPDRGSATFAVVLAGASAGFLAWNWPPARIFMGDVGSGFLGFALGALALIAHRLEGLSLWVPTILLGLFVTDATLTLVRRMLRGERWHAAHRSHAYQWLARRFRAHFPVTMAAASVNVFWLLPLSIMAALHPPQAPFIVGIAYAPLIVVAVLAGAGRPERT